VIFGLSFFNFKAMLKGFSFFVKVNAAAASCEVRASSIGPRTISLKPCLAGRQAVACGLRPIFFIFFLTLSLSAQSQELIVKDTLIGELIAPIDTLAFSLPTDLEYIPADATPLLVADRLSCIQKTIELTYNTRVHGFIDYFTIRDREYTRMVQRRKDLYFPIFERKLKEYGLPDELKYLSIIESGLNPRATSRASAVGLWQFMPGTGHWMGLHKDWYIDERMDPEKSTDAACRYLAQLYSMFHDWQLVLAAYNSGPGTVRHAIKKSGYKKTFWEVFPRLPRETRSYVPQFIAIVYAMNYAPEHNLLELSREEVPPHDTIQVKQFLHFATFANLTGTCVEDMQRLNPSVMRSALPDNGRNHVLKIPVWSKTALNLNRQIILDSASKIGKKELESLVKINYGSSTYGREVQIYRVQSGDVLGTIAEKFGVRVNDLKGWNGLFNNKIRVGQRINIWTYPVRSAATVRSATEIPSSIIIPPNSKTYIVQPGDTLWDISKKLPGVSVEKIKNLNNLKGNKLQPGQKLIIG
jgi:membrane-bound lytic murein transglycosylase D